jgi:membrane-bound metal-dependent hydrolase YbcI (DUF457 family)
MFNNFNLSNPESEYQLEYYNSIGLLFSDQLILNKNNKLVEFNIQEIKSIYFKKERELTQNYLIFIIACSLFAFSIYFNNKEVLFQKTGIIMAVGILLYALVKRTYTYNIVLFTHYSHLFSIPVNYQDKDDACELIAKTTHKVRTNKNYMQAS